jgi:hypothetical protein
VVLVAWRGRRVVTEGDESREMDIFKGNSRGGTQAW